MGKKKKGRVTAVLVFKASATELSQETEGKQFQDASEEWESMISFFRSGGKRYNSWAESQQYTELKCIFGPISNNGYKVVYFIHTVPVESRSQ